MSGNINRSVGCRDEVQEEEETGRFPEGQVKSGEDEAQSW